MSQGIYKSGYEQQYAQQSVVEDPHPVQWFLEIIADAIPGGWWAIGGLTIVGLAVIFKKRIGAVLNWFVKDFRKS